MNVDMSNQPYMNNNIQSMSMPTMTIYAMSYTHICTYTNENYSTLPWVSELMSKYEVMSVNMNSIDDIKQSVGSIDTKMTEMKREIDTLSRRVTS